MALTHRSIATIDSPEFINLQPLDINPLMSACEIKVFYLGESRNKTFISKETALEMAKTLRGAPIVGYYRQEKQDFLDHGDKITLDAEGIHFECMTRPYGFVSPDAKVWFQKFDDTDDFGNTITREYLMTTGYLWTGQFPEAQSVFEDGGKPHSMELDEKTLEGHWAENSKSGMEFFIINDAIFSKLCILGNDIEPCFEGSSVTSPDISANFSLDSDFTKTLFSMMKELEYALKGDNTVLEENKTVEEQEIAPAEDFSIDQDNIDKSSLIENEENIEDASNSSEFVQKDKDDEDKEEEETDDGQEEVEEEEDEDKKPKAQNSLHTDEEYTELEEKYNNLLSEFNNLNDRLNDLVDFKNQVEDAQKDALIEKFFMLSDEDKKDVRENKRQYSLDDIEAKLAVICYRKKVNFDLDATSKEDKAEDPSVVTFNLQIENDSTPDWIKAVEDVQNKL